MYRRSRTLSIDDQKAVDVCLDHTVAAGKTGVTRFATPVQQRRLTSASKLLALLAELPAVDPPEDLVARTMERIDRDSAQKMGRLPKDSVSPSAPIH